MSTDPDRPEAPEPSRPVPGPPPMVKPARGALTVKDMVVAIGVLLAVVLVIGGLSRGFSFAPTGPTVDPAAVPVVDASAELRGLVSTVPFALRVPDLPAGWRSTSVAVDRVGATGRKDVRVGYLTAQSRYLQLLQSDAAEEALLADQSGTRRLVAQGVRDVAGQRWVVYGAQPDEPIWIADVATSGGAPVRMLISGTGTDDDYTLLAQATQNGTPLHHP